MKLLKCLNSTNNVPSKEQLSLATNLMKILFSIYVYDIIMVIENIVLIQSEKPDRSITMEK